MKTLPASKTLLSLGLMATLGLLSPAAHADENFLAFSYSAETLPKGKMEISQTLTRRWDKGVGTFNAIDFDTEVEYGVTDKFSISGYLQGVKMKSKNAFPDDDAGNPAPYNNDLNKTQITGVKTMLKYNFLSPYKDGIGITGALEAAYVFGYRKIDLAKTKQYSIEPKLIVQKNFMNDQLIMTYNLGIEIEKRSFPASGAAENEISITQNFGGAYRFAPGWYAGLEGRHHADILNGKKNNNTTFLGPSLHYAANSWYVTAGYLKQIKGNKPYTGYDVDPNAPTANSKYHLEEDVKNEFRVKFAYAFN